MKITVESTSKFVELRIGQEMVPARVWEGKTELGVPCFAFVTHIAPAILADRLTPEEAAEFTRDLEETRPPSPDLDRAIPLRLIL
jgi:hypothetical protein